MVNLLALNLITQLISPDALDKLIDSRTVTLSQTKSYGEVERIDLWSQRRRCVEVHQQREGKLGLLPSRLSTYQLSVYDYLPIYLYRRGV